jgi:hypothetical protein
LNAFWRNLFRPLTDTRLVRQGVEVVFRTHGRRHLARLDHEPPGRAQLRTLLGLVRQAQNIRFGRDHDFRRIRTTADFRRLVPVRTPIDLCRVHCDSVPSAPPSVLSFRSALRTALALVADARPRDRLLAGKLLWLADDSSLEAARIARERIPTSLRPYAHLALAPEGPDGPTSEQALGPASCDVTCLAGRIEHLLPLLERVRQVRGRAHLDQVWPCLCAVLYARRDRDSDVAPLRAAVGDRVLLLETLLLPEAPLAVEDPRYGGLRLLTGHGVFFEFLPAALADRPDAPRLGIEEVRVGPAYDLVVTSAAGLWACRVGLAVRFTRLDVPVLRDVVPLAPLPTFSPPVRRDGPQAAPQARANRQRSAGIPEARPESYARSPWSTPADPG